MTVFDVLDAAVVSLAVVVWLRSGVPDLGWSVAGLVIAHVFGRLVITNFADPVPMIAVGFSGMAFAFLVAPLFSNYGRIAGSLFAFMSIACWTSVLAGDLSPVQDGGLAIDLWNVLSVALHLVGITIIIGIARYGKLANSGGARYRL